MIVPSIDIRDGRAVQLRQGKEFVLDGGDPLEMLDELSVVGEVAVVDLDAAIGTGSNRDLIRRMIRRASCRVGGGIRTREQAVEWLNLGAAHIMVGTAASPEFFEGLPRERLIAAVDADRANVVVEGWSRATNVDPVTRVTELAPHVGGFLCTQVEHEGGMAGFDWSLVERVSTAASECRVTAAGGITSAEEIGRLDRMGVDAQVGMALYTGKLSLGDGLASCLVTPENETGRDPIIWPTIVRDDGGTTLGLVWSSAESLVRAIEEREGIYWSRSRRQLWRKGETSGNRQTLLEVALDCDHDTLQFTVRQHGSAFCHTGSRSCFGAAFDLGALAGLIDNRRESSDLKSRTVQLFNDPDLLGSKLREEAAELADAVTEDEVIHEAADVLYFTLTAMSRAGVRLADVVRELERRSGAVVRRKLATKPTKPTKPTKATKATKATKTTKPTKATKATKTTKTTKGTKATKATKATKNTNITKTQEKPEWNE